MKAELKYLEMKLDNKTSEKPIVQQEAKGCDCKIVYKQNKQTITVEITCFKALIKQRCVFSESADYE